MRTCRVTGPARAILPDDLDDLEDDWAETRCVRCGRPSKMTLHNPRGRNTLLCLACYRRDKS